MSHSLQLKTLSFHKPSLITAINSRTKKVLFTHLYATKNIHNRARGLMFRKLVKGEALLFTMPRIITISLHMFFVFVPIDVLLLKEEKEGFEVIEKKENFKPFTIHTAKNKAKLFLELPAGSTTDVQVGDILLI